MALRSLEVYKRWLLDTYLQSGRSSPILVLPLGEVGPDHRDEWPGCVSPPPQRSAKFSSLTTDILRSDDRANDQQLWEPLLVAPIVGAPELVVPGNIRILISLSLSSLFPFPFLCSRADGVWADTS